MVATASTTWTIRRADPAAAALLAVGTAPIVAYVVIVVRRIGYPYELSYFEGSTVEVTARVVAGLPLYGPPTTDFTPWPYPPLYFWLTAGLTQLTGPHISALRWVSFVASLVVLGLITVIVRRVGGSVVAGIVAAGVYAASYPVSGAWADTGRVDSLFLALLLGAILAGVRARSAVGGVAVGVLFTMAFLTKQNAMFVAGPVLFWLLWHRRPAGIAATVTLIGAVVTSTVVGDLVTGGWYSPSVFGQLLGQAWAWPWLAEFWLLDVALPFAIVIVLTIRLLGRSRCRSDGSTRWRRSDRTACLLSGVVGLLLAAWAGRVHDGGYANVAMPAHVAVALSFGLVLGAAHRRRAVTARTAFTIAAALAVQFVAMIAWHPDVLPTAADRAAGDAFISAVRQLPAPVLIPSHPYYARLAGQPTTASTIAIDDALRAPDGRVATAVRAALPWSLAGVNAVVLDNPDQTVLFGDGLSRDFTLVTNNFVPDGAFAQVTDRPSRPSLLYVRTSELPFP